MKNSSLIAILFSVSFFSAAAFAQDNPPEVIKQGDVSYLTGGVGDGEKEFIEAHQKEYNVHIQSASAAGEFAGDTHITISDKSGKKWLDADIGPVLYTTLPAGNYTIEATSEGQRQKKPLVIKGKKSVYLSLIWKD